MKKIITTTFVLISLAGCAWIADINPRTLQDVERDVAAAETLVGGLAVEIKAAKDAGLIQPGTPIATSIVSAMQIAANSLTGANNAIQAGQVNAADLLYQTAEGAIQGLRTDVPKVPTTANTSVTP